MDIVEHYYTQLRLIRCFEEKLLAEFQSGVFFGTTHTSIGQEANAVGVLTPLEEDDLVVSNHRCHGHFLAYGGSPQALFAELMGKPSGICGGRGGSQHLCWRNFFSNGVLGGTLPFAAGLALAEKQQKRRSVTVAFVGDGALGEGLIYETLNMASLWGAPLLIVVEYNHIAQTTPTHTTTAGDFITRFGAFDISAHLFKSSDVMEIVPFAQDLLALVRARRRPYALVLDTARLGPHSKSDDTRNPAELDLLRQQRDPLEIHAHRLDAAVRAKIDAEIDAQIQAAYQAALAENI